MSIAGGLQDYLVSDTGLQQQQQQLANAPLNRQLLLAQIADAQSMTNKRNLEEQRTQASMRIAQQEQDIRRQVAQESSKGQVGQSTPMAGSGNPMIDQLAGLFNQELEVNRRTTTAGLPVAGAESLDKLTSIYEKYQTAVDKTMDANKKQHEDQQSQLKSANELALLGRTDEGLGAIQAQIMSMYGDYAHLPPALRPLIDARSAKDAKPFIDNLALNTEYGSKLLTERSTRAEKAASAAKDYAQVALDKARTDQLEFQTKVEKEHYNSLRKNDGEFSPSLGDLKGASTARQSALQSSYSSNVFNAITNLDQEIGNLVQLPSTSRSSSFSGVIGAQGDSLTEGLKGAVGRKLTKDDAQIIQASVSGMSRMLAVATGSGRAGDVNKAIIDSYDKELQGLKEGSSTMAALNVFARLKQQVNLAISNFDKKPGATPEQKQELHQVADRLNQTIPWSMEDIVNVNKKGRKSFTDQAKETLNKGTPALPPGFTLDN